MKWLADNWQKLSVTLPLLVTIVIFLVQRSAEMRWRRTEFLFAQAQYLDSDPDIKRIVAVLEGRIETPSVAAMVSEDSAMSPRDRKEYLASLDKFLNFFDRLYFAVHSAETLKIEEVKVFGWYLALVLEDPVLVKYCNEMGFADVVTLAKQIPEHAAR